MANTNKLSDVVAARIRAVMAAKRLTVADISESLGISSDAVSRRLNGKAEFSLSQIDALAKYTGYDPSDFLASSFSVVPLGRMA